MIGIGVYYPTEIALRNGDDNPGNQLVHITSAELSRLSTEERETLARYVAPCNNPLRVERTGPDGVVEAVQKMHRLTRLAREAWKAQAIAEPSERLWDITRENGIFVPTRKPGAYHFSMPRLSDVSIEGTDMSANHADIAWVLADAEVEAAAMLGRVEKQAECDRRNAEEAAADAARAQRDKEALEKSAQEEARREERKRQRVAWLKAHARQLDLDAAIVRAAEEERGVWREIETSVLDAIEDHIRSFLVTMNVEIQREIGLVNPGDHGFDTMLRKGTKPSRRPNPSPLAYEIFDRLRDAHLSEWLTEALGTEVICEVKDIMRVDMARYEEDEPLWKTGIQLRIHVPLVWASEGTWYVPCEIVTNAQVAGDATDDE